MSKKKDYLMESDKNIFLTGKAGTGKTYQINRFVEKMQAEGKVVLVSAPTGTAAVNAGGETAHSLFGIPIPCYGVSISKVPPAKIKTLAMADVVIIDEVSMMRNDAFSFAMRVLKKAEKLKGSKIRVILTGDFSQLPPVVQKKDISYLKKFGYDLSGYAFTTKEWAALHLKTVELTKIWRQEDGSELAEQLGKVRDNDPTAINYFKQFVKEDYQASDDEIQICGTNAEADEINRNYLNSIPGPVMAYQAEKKGRNAAGICEDIVLLKQNARVMFLVNDVKKNQYQNGSMGTIMNLNEKCVEVLLDTGRLIPVFPYEYKSYSYRIVGGNLTKNEIGSVKQMPLKVAKAITIHKSQGKTFDKVVITPNIFAAGQLYVALSRVKSPEGLVLTSEVKLEHLKDNPIVEEFYANGFTYEVKEKTVGKSKGTGTKKTPAKKTAGRKTSSRTTKKAKTSGSSASKKRKTTGTKANTSTGRTKMTASKKKKETKKMSEKKTVTKKTTTAKAAPAKKTAAKPAATKATAAKKTAAKAPAKTTKATAAKTTAKKTAAVAKPAAKKPAAKTVAKAAPAKKPAAKKAESAVMATVKKSAEKAVKAIVAEGKKTPAKKASSKK